jgi:hypothetical protein
MYVQYAPLSVVEMIHYYFGILLVVFRVYSLYLVWHHALPDAIIKIDNKKSPAEKLLDEKLPTEKLMQQLLMLKILLYCKNKKHQPKKRFFIISIYTCV